MRIDFDKKSLKTTLSEMRPACDTHRRPFVGVSRPRSWSRFPVRGAILLRFFCQKFTNLVKNDFQIPLRRALRGEHGAPSCASSLVCWEKENR